jgi:dTDP-4-dehydrorhamnose reductase
MWYHGADMSGTIGRLALFGGGGFVGGNLAAAALRRGIAVDIVDAAASPGAPGLQDARWHAADITDAAAVRSLVAELRPDCTVDLAAVADIDRAERERDLAWAVNVEAARSIASACAGAGCGFLYFSSDAVFAGTAPLYSEEDLPEPVNYYGMTKAEGEKAVRAAHPRACILRISLALGFPVTRGNSFLAGLEAALKAGKEIAAPASEVRTPVDVHTLCACVLELADRGFAGTLHVGSTDSIDRAALTRKAAGLLGYPGARIVADPPTTPGRAPRHSNGIISVEKARGLLATPLLDVEQTIRRAVLERS